MTNFEKQEKGHKMITLKCPKCGKDYNLEIHGDLLVCNNCGYKEAPVSEEEKEWRSAYLKQCANE